MGVCCRYALSMVIPSRLRDCSYSRGRDFISLAISLASLPGKTGKTKARRVIAVPPRERWPRANEQLRFGTADQDWPVTGIFPVLDYRDKEDRSQSAMQLARARTLYIS
jgi:hypothetical protein